MRFAISQADLAQALSSAAPIIPQRAPLPILSNLLLELEGNRLRLTATDLDIYIVTDVDVTGEEDGVTTVSGRRFAEIVRELPNEEISIVSENGQTTLRCGRRNYRFLGMATSDFPTMPATMGAGGIDVSVAHLVKALNHTTFSVSTDESRPNLQGALCQVEDGRLRLVASDSHRLVRYEVAGEYKDDLQAIIPLKTLQFLQRNLGAGAGTARVEICGSYLGCSFDRTSVYSRLIEGPFPDYKKVIPEGNDTELYLDRESFIRALRRVAVLSSAQTRQVRLAIEAGEIRVSTNTPEVGDASEIIDAKYDGEGMEVGFNAQYLLDVLRHMETEEVLLRLGGSTSAGLVEPSGLGEDESYLCLVMPLRLGSGY